MAEIPIQNETEYTLPPSILDQIKRDALEYFGESVNAIRIQYGIERHAFNARSGEVRYAFSPSDFGLVDTAASFPDNLARTDDVPSIDGDREAIAAPAFDDSDVDDDDEAPEFTSLDSDLDVVADDDGTDFQRIEADFDALEDSNNDFLYDDDYDN
ncbi:MAG: hypothetical protein ETSY2_39020 [Candidatus Entotheonella gemina]|uniref:Uncharacterized protein n=1 Tax=Candidatus Entotheonella gemina TaxID=1429439 RepID=W4LSS2_9BACT|nr:MAG: hypothetical protein ETSY2_39020 [Candidatus Entotheonella gemina]